MLLNRGMTFKYIFDKNISSVVSIIIYLICQFLMKLKSQQSTL